MELVYIEWFDASSPRDERSWYDYKDIEGQLPASYCINVGFVLHKPTKKEPWYILAPCLGLCDCSKPNPEHMEVGQPFRIPSGCVHKIKKLTIPRGWLK